MIFNDRFCFEVEVTTFCTFKYFFFSGNAAQSHKPDYMHKPPTWYNTNQKRSAMKSHSNFRYAHGITPKRVTQWFSTFFKILTLRPRKIFSITHCPSFLSINFHAKSSEEQKKITSADGQSSTIQWNDMIYQKSATSLRSP